MTNIRLIAATAVALPLAACAGSYADTDPETPPAPATCNADAAQSFVGQKATPDLGAAILKASGARTLRWVAPRSAMTMDYREDRVNVTYDDDYKIEKVNCG